MWPGLCSGCFANISQAQLSPFLFPLSQPQLQPQLFNLSAARALNSPTCCYPSLPSCPLLSVIKSAASFQLLSALLFASPADRDVHLVVHFCLTHVQTQPHPLRSPLSLALSNKACSPSEPARAAAARSPSIGSINRALCLSPLRCATDSCESSSPSDLAPPRARLVDQPAWRSCTRPASSCSWLGRTSRGGELAVG